MEKTFLNKKRKIYLTQNFPENLLPNKKLTKKSRSLINQKTRSFQNRIKNNLKNLRKLIIRDLNRKSNFKDNFYSLHLKNYKNKNFLNYGKILYNGIPSGEKSVILLSIFLNIIPRAKHFLPKEGNFYKLYTSCLPKEAHPNPALQGREEKFPKFKYSLEQILSEFYKKNSQSSGGKKQSFFKELLMEQKKLSIIYGNLSIKEIKKSVLEAKKKNGNFEENLIKKLESRLDVVLYRICFFKTICAARQSINHGQVFVNNKKVVFSGYILKPGDLIKINKETRKSLKETLLKKYKKEIEGRSLPFLLDNHLILKLFSYQYKINTSIEISKKGITKYTSKNPSAEKNLFSVPNKSLICKTKERNFENKYNPRCFLNGSESYFTKENIKNPVSLHELASRKKDKEAASLQKQIVSSPFRGSRVFPSCFLLPPEEVKYKNPCKSRVENPFLINLHNIIDVQSKNFPPLPFSSEKSKKQEGYLPIENWDRISPALFHPKDVLRTESRVKKESQPRFGINKLGLYFLKYLQNFFDFKKKLKSVSHASFRGQEGVGSKSRKKTKINVLPSVLRTGSEALPSAASSPCFRREEKSFFKDNKKSSSLPSFERKVDTGNNFFLKSKDFASLPYKVKYTQKQILKQKKFFAKAGFKHKPLDFYIDNMEKSNQVLDLLKIEKFLSKNNFSLQILETTKQKKKLENSIKKTPSCPRMLRTAQGEENKKQIFNIKEKNKSMISFLILKRKCASKNSPFLRLAPFRVSSQKPVHLEISYKNLFAIFLYSPQRALFPAHIDFAKVRKIFR